MTREHFEEDQRKFHDAKSEDERGGIGWALRQLVAGATVARRGWNGRGMHLFYVAAIDDWLPFVAMKTAQGPTVPWLCSQTDLLALDWEIVNAAPKVTPLKED